MIDTGIKYAILNPVSYCELNRTRPQRMIAINIFATFVSLIISAFTSQYLWGLFVFQGFFLGVSQGIGMVRKRT